MSNDGDPQSPGPQPNPFNDVRSDGPPGQPPGTSDVEPGRTSAAPGSFDDAALGPQPTEPLPEYFSATSGSPLPPVIEAFPGYQGVQQRPKKVGKEVVGSRVTGWPAGVGIGVAGIAVILVVVVITVLLTHRRGPNPSPPAAQLSPSAALPPSPSPPPALTTPEQLNGILLSVADINAVMGASDMEATNTGEELRSTGTMSNQDCLGALYAAQREVYAGSGQTAVLLQDLHEPGRDHVVIQAAVTFPSADEASRFVQNSAGKWRNCANQTVTTTLDKRPDRQVDFCEPQRQAPGTHAERHPGSQ